MPWVVSSRAASAPAKCVLLNGLFQRLHPRMPKTESRARSLGPVFDYQFPLKAPSFRANVPMEPCV